MNVGEPKGEPALPHQATPLGASGPTWRLSGSSAVKGTVSRGRRPIRRRGRSGVRTLLMFTINILHTSMYLSH